MKKVLPEATLSLVNQVLVSLISCRSLPLPYILFIREDIISFFKARRAEFTKYQTLCGHCLHLCCQLWQATTLLPFSTQMAPKWLQRNFAIHAHTLWCRLHTRSEISHLDETRTWRRQPLSIFTSESLLGSMLLIEYSSVVWMLHVPANNIFTINYNRSGGKFLYFQFQIYSRDDEGHLFANCHIEHCYCFGLAI